MAKRPEIPYKAIADAALNSIESLLNQWLPDGERRGGTYFARNPTRHDDKPNSFFIYFDKGVWQDAATDDKGGDLISLYAYINYIEQWEAAIEVADQIGFVLPEGCRPDEKSTRPKQARVVDPATVKQKKPSEPSPWVPIYPDVLPENAEEAPKAHSVRGLPAMRFSYYNANGRLIGYVCRFNTSDGGKETLPLVYCKNTKSQKYEWRWMQWPAPNRPLYGLNRLTEKPEAYVLLVEGEKCADAPLGLIAGVPVSWTGGSKGVDKVDWSPLAGRKIYAWPDCDAQRETLTKEEKEQGIDAQTKPLLAERAQPGTLAMLKIRDKLLAIDPTTEFHFVDIPAPGEKPSGWDVADAIDEGMNAAALMKFITKTRPHLSLVEPAEPNEQAKNETGAEPAAAKGDGIAPTWKDYLLKKRDETVSCLSNIVDILENDERWQGVIAYDEFGQRVVKLKPPPFWDKKGKVGEWDSVDDARTAMWITKVYRFSPSASMVAEAVEVMAHNTLINPPKDWMNSLKWDGQKRLSTWMLDFMGVEVTEYSKRVAVWFFMGMVKRVFEPGCQFDYCIVLDGDQGLKKSSALEAIGGEWFGNTDLDLSSKDSMSAIRGKMLYEFSELGSLAKAEATKQKSFLTRRIDEFRAPYGRREIRALRTVLFSGTTNEWEWNKDPTGGRRWWPVTVKNMVDADGLREVREQLFAEAVVRVNAGHRYWPTPQEQKELFDPEQISRAIQESFVDALHDHVNSQVGEFSVFYAGTEWLKMDAAKLTRDIQTRIGISLRQLGCSRIEKRHDKISRYWYIAPEVKHTTKQNQLDKGDFDDSIPF